MLNSVYNHRRHHHYHHDDNNHLDHQDRHHYDQHLNHHDHHLYDHLIVREQISPAGLARQHRLAAPGAKMFYQDFRKYFKFTKKGETVVLL